jgi:hypothetical protein
MTDGYRLWLCLAKDSGRLSRGAESWREVVGETYRWDDSVQRSREPKPGDVIALWNDDVGLLGFSWIESIKTGHATRTKPRCSKCGRADINDRETMSPRWKCKRQDCKAEFEQPYYITEDVVTFAAEYAAGWTPVPERSVPPSSCRVLSTKPKSQHSIREIEPSRFEATLALLGKPTTQIFESRKKAIHGGFTIATVRVRRGQGSLRKALLARYGPECAITGPCPTRALDAAHLYRYSRLGEHHDDGALLLRADVHRLFDDGQLTVDPLTSCVKLLGEAKASPAYSHLEGSVLRVDVSAATRQWLTTHWAQHHDFAQ